MAFSVVLDACVLYPASLRDTLLRFAAADFFIPVCSERILDEVERNLLLDGRMNEQQAAHLRDRMEAIFADAWAPSAAIAGLEPAMTNDPKDRHVLAAAVVSEAQTIVTQNLKDFPPASTAPYGIDVQHPDEFLLGLHGLAPGLSAGIVTMQAAALQRPPLSVDELLANLTVAGVPEFAAAVAAEVG